MTEILPPQGDSREPSADLFDSSQEPRKVIEDMTRRGFEIHEQAERSDAADLWRPLTSRELDVIRIPHGQYDVRKPRISSAYKAPGHEPIPEAPTEDEQARGKLNVQAILRGIEATPRRHKPLY